MIVQLELLKKNMVFRQGLSEIRMGEIPGAISLLGPSEKKQSGRNRGGVLMTVGERGLAKFLIETIENPPEYAN